MCKYNTIAGKEEEAEEEEEAAEEEDSYLCFASSLVNSKTGRAAQRRFVVLSFRKLFQHSVNARREAGMGFPSTPAYIKQVRGKLLYDPSHHQETNPFPSDHVSKCVRRNHGGKTWAREVSSAVREYARSLLEDRNLLFLLPLVALATQEKSGLSGGNMVHQRFLLERRVRR
jgi:hypothetical protein